MMIDAQNQLFDEDFVLLFSKTIPQLLLASLSNPSFSCVSCSSDLEGLNPISYSCGCKACNACVLKKLGESTDNKFVLNHFEKTSIITQLY